ncbi:UNVERIFIED_CONTAM: hypothetical protein K2H54_062939 [Gekko kuhli]
MAVVGFELESPWCLNYFIVLSHIKPTFRYFTWHTCVLGIAGCTVMVFFISPIYASASVAFMIVLLLALHYLSPSSSWGYISQALIFHQVSKAPPFVLTVLENLINESEMWYWRGELDSLVPPSF